VIRNLFKKKPEERSDTYDRYFDRLTASSPVAGIDVNANSAEALAAVYACVATIAYSASS